MNIAASYCNSNWLQYSYCLLSYVHPIHELKGNSRVIRKCYYIIPLFRPPATPANNLGYRPDQGSWHPTENKPPPPHLLSSEPRGTRDPRGISLLKKVTLFLATLFLPYPGKGGRRQVFPAFTVYLCYHALTLFLFFRRNQCSRGKVSTASGIITHSNTPFFCDLRLTFRLLHNTTRLPHFLVSQKNALSALRACLHLFHIP